MLVMSQEREVRGDDIWEVSMGCKGINSVALSDGGGVLSEASFLRSAEFGFWRSNRHEFDGRYRNR